jgi:methylthioribose-1-phosphate isomerase
MGPPELRSRASPPVNIQGHHFRTIWLSSDGWAPSIIDQTDLPHAVTVRRLEDVDQAAEAIRSMRVRGAPLIGVTAAYGLCLAVRADPSDESISRAAALLLATRPTAVNLRWALDEMKRALSDVPEEARRTAAYAKAEKMGEDDVAACRAIGRHGVELVREAWERTRRSRPVRILTHCNAGWLAAVDWGTALAPIYAAEAEGIPVHVWVDETRPRNQGMLTAWELGEQGIPHAIIADNAGGHLMQRGQVDLCITGTDRTTSGGDVCNKIGTYLKALAARDNGIPFYVACPGSSIDWTLYDGGAIPIEERDPRELLEISGRTPSGELARVRLAPEGSRAANYAFDVTPSRLVTALVTERGICPASREGLEALYGSRP